MKMSETTTTGGAVEVHYQTPEEKLELNRLGMWVFLASEVMFFGGLFTIYLVYRWLYPQVFATASRELDLVLGTINTAILLTSSFTMALAVHAIQAGSRRALTLFLLLTMLLGLAFIGIKGTEYLHVINEGLFPNREQLLTLSADERPGQIFFSLYFAMTGLHLLHMLLGLLVIAFLIVQANLFKRYSAADYSAIENMGLYWHFVDIVWIFIFPLLYLIDRTS
jgi:cytochrome c oxidase subunit 3